MSHQVIARKWRPQQFEDVVGQDVITRALRNALRMKRLHHAYLFAGPRGVGKTTCARLFARALNCREGPTPTPCGVCPSCQEIMTGESLDVLEIDAASHTGVDNIREVIIATVSNRPARDRYKIFIIDEVHMLSTSAFNALLKTLEEPPPHVVFILATTELYKLPETILSRCQPYEFRTIGVEVIADHLQRIAEAERIKISRAALIQIAHAGRGSMRDAQSAFDQVLAFAGPDAVIDESDVRESLGLIGAALAAEVMDALDAADAAAMIRHIARLVRGGYDLRQFLRELMTYVRHLLVAHVVGVDRELLPLAESELNLVERQCQRFTVADLIRFFSLLVDLEAQARAAEDARPLVEVGLVKLTQLGRLKPLEEILARLEALAAGDNEPPTPSGRLATAVKATPPPKPPPRAVETTRRSTPAPVERQPLRLVPPPEPPVEDAPLDDDAPVGDASNLTDADALFKRLKALIEKERPLLAVHLDAVTAVHWQGNAFELVFGPQSKAAEAYVAQPSEKLLLRERLQALTKKTLSIVTRLERDRSKTPLSEPQARDAALRAEAERHPTVQVLQKTFGAELIDVKAPDEK
ncbi:MAG: DNA polymerase III subunit gamma/tau [Chloracidobacterium sp.]|nr:DNA polymerase III subunit gamma/tau [Chloracidobacterium sp.]MDW8218207.1 DNA polymerase III subunit gamma/tau [Acidobacteriota bacterium]